ncbi:MAG: ribonucleoside triphosphate reductase [Spirochaetales bacterium]|nr:ribonucleoside triphosphate reductase [Spirochaetales bacterium]
MKIYVKELVKSRQSSKIANLVKKRDGKIVEFDPSKIANAISKAFSVSKEGDEAKAWEATGYVVSRIETEIVDIETIQDLVEETLMNMGYRKTAKMYILYRAKRAEARNITNAFNAAFSMIEDYIKENDWRVRENSNMSYSLQGLNSHISSTLISEYWLNKIYTPDIAEAHRKGYIHIHDLGSLSSYCVGWDLEQLLFLGFTGVAGKVESKPAKHFRTALGQIANFFYTMQGEAAGAQAFSNFDTLLAPFIRFDKLNYNEVKQSMQEFIFNLNVPTRTGFQTPFTNITFDLVVPPNLKDKAIIIGGQLLDSTYQEYKPEMKMILKAFCEVMLEGDGKGRPFTFPIPTINITKDFDFNQKDYDPLWELTAKYGTPYFSNFVNSSMNVEDSRSMCCRLKLDNKKIKQRLSKIIEEQKDHSIRRGGLFASNPMTGSIGVVTINLARLAFISKNEGEFFNRLDEIIRISKTSLELKRKIIEDLTDNGLYPYTKFYLKDVKLRTGHYWANHFSTIGLIGMNEAVQNLLKISYLKDEGKEFAEKTLDFILERIEKISEETGNMYNLEASPAEGASYRLALIDKKEFGNIITSGTEERPYYTNSVQLPVNISDDLFEVCDHQDKIQSKFTGGTVLHIFVGQHIVDIEALKNLIKKIAYTYSLPYFSITPTYSICPVHGYIPGEKWICEKQHSTEELDQFGVLLNEIEAFNYDKIKIEDKNMLKEKIKNDKRNFESNFIEYDLFSEENKDIHKKDIDQKNTFTQDRKNFINDNIMQKVIPCEVYSRVVGYYRPVQNWNDGKRMEFYERKVFKI